MLCLKSCLSVKIAETTPAPASLQPVDKALSDGVIQSIKLINKYFLHLLFRLIIALKVTGNFQDTRMHTGKGEV